MTDQGNTADSASNKEPTVRNAVLHIGTEKTGSTSIQNFFYRNRGALISEGVLFPKHCGFVSHHKLVISCQNEPDKNLAQISSLDCEPAAFQQWLQAFKQTHSDEVTEFQKKSGNQSTVVYSSEHFQSRVKDVDEIARLYDFLSSLYDTISVVVYLRRQDRLAISAHNTQIQGGLTRHFDFSKVNPAGNYFNYLKLVSNWASVFGKQNITVRIFEKDRMENGNVVDDFINIVNINPDFPKKIVPSIENSHLSFTSLELLIQFNEQYNNEQTINEFPASRFRQWLIKRLHKVNDDHGKILPSRESAQAFYEKCKILNQEMFDTYLPGEQFDESFDEYPASDTDRPPQPSPDILANLIEEITRKKQANVVKMAGDVWTSVKQKYGT